MPLPDSSVSVIAAIDMLLFPSETARVLAHDGVLLWVNQLGGDGPLYLPATAVAAALPGTWHATGSEAGWGTWAVLRRTRRHASAPAASHSRAPGPAQGLHRDRCCRTSMAPVLYLAGEFLALH
ncbi:hypothetical protein [Streptomyces sp. NPDC021356]|uniref:hypothetical protein n=1 Tax=Streptomyces sp. NPDC021356 TaxID=3154900 RepID=UPI0033CBCE81